jgi:hypothetical protein
LGSAVQRLFLSDHGKRNVSLLAAAALVLFSVAAAEERSLAVRDLRSIADARLVQLGYRVADFEVSVLHKLRPADFAFLEQERIPNVHLLRVVYYAPLPDLTPDTGQFGDDITIYLDPTTGEVVAEWLGQ